MPSSRVEYVIVQIKSREISVGCWQAKIQNTTGTKCDRARESSIVRKREGSTATKANARIQDNTQLKLRFFSIFLVVVIFLLLHFYFLVYTDTYLLLYSVAYLLYCCIVLFICFKKKQKELRFDVQGDQ